MIRAAGILFITPDKKALFLLRGRGGDFPLQWCLPGGQCHENEDFEDCADREATEELGSIPEGIKIYLTRSQATSSGVDPEGETELPGQAAVGETVDYVTYVQKVSEEFSPKINGEHIGFCWCPINEAPQPLHPGVAIALKRVDANEMQIAKMIASGELTSPQRVENMMLYAMRMSGTGVSYRKGLDEFVWRDPGIWNTPEMAERCAGVPLIFEHPATSILNSEEFSDRVIGTVMFGYVQGNELWCLCRVYDAGVIQMLEEEKLSTSPAVVFRNPDVNSKMKLEDGSDLLVEGVPSCIDHLAVCEKGVWDKGGPALGIEQVDVKADAETKDDVTLSIPLLIRLMEYAREDAPDDAALHFVAERAIAKGKLSMEDYLELVKPQAKADSRLDSAAQKLTLMNVRFGNYAASRRK